KLTTSVDTELTEQAEHSPQEMALQQGSIVAEGEMVRATDCDAEPSIRRQTIINRLDVGLDLTDFRVGRKIAVVAQEKHERLVDACLNDAAVQRTVHVDACLAPGILSAEVRSCRSAKRVAKYSHARHVEPTRELAG